MERTVTNPPIPYTGPIHGGFSTGKIARIQGTVPPTSERFDINLLCGPNKDESDIALHISVRISQGYIARNSCQFGNWGDEQGHGNLTIGPGQSFEIIVLCDQTQFKIAVNGQHFCEFPQRISHDRISHISIDGDVSISLISFEAGGGGDGSDFTSSSRAHQYSGPPPGAPAYGPPPSAPYGAPGPYGGGPPGAYPGVPQGAYPGGPQGGYPGGPQGQYGPPPPYAGPGGAYGAPPPPPGGAQESGYGDLLDTAQSLITGAIASGTAEKLLGGILGGGGSHPPQHQQPQAPPPPAQPTFPTSDFGGQGSLGGLGSIGSLLQQFAGQAFAHKKRPHGPHPPPYSGTPQPPAPVGMPMPSLPTSAHNLPPYPSSTRNLPPYPSSTGNLPPYPSSTGNLPPYPSSTGNLPPYPSTTGNLPPYSNNHPYPRSPYPTANVGYPAYPPIPPGHHHGAGDSLKTAAAIGGPLAAATAMYHGHKKLKKSKLKKAMKYGLPIAGAGVGAYALHKAFKHSSSSSSSSSSD